ncbi:MAG: DegT/DnrJ/EryC1/StrS family aminotransferase, partial [Alphaproteobacteria bacterium]|nr:DegT/DnrJ/EryC1/StrS family aminotransferase [Alphaproteobacteria bacterium]
GPEFLGGPAVRGLEDDWCRVFECKHAVSVNSATSGLIAAVGAAGVGPGDEVIVPAWTMSATAVTAVAYGAVPVFVDVEDRTFCLDPEKAAAAITPRTRAIIAVNLFGHPAELAALRDLADANGIYLIEDNAQAPLAREQGTLTGNIGHIGVYSLNVHKHIQCGEGGVCTTADAGLAERLQQIRNHGENVVGANADLANAFGFNLRMTETTAAIARAQVARAEEIITGRIAIAEALRDGLARIPGLTVPETRSGCSHAFYLWTARIDEGELGISRAAFHRALEAEGVPTFTGYVAPLYRLAMFQRRTAIGRDGFPFAGAAPDYADGLCPVTERLHEREALVYEVCAWDPSDSQLEQMIAAVHKVIENRDALRDAGADAA